MSTFALESRRHSRSFKFDEEFPEVTGDPVATLYNHDLVPYVFQLTLVIQAEALGLQVVDMVLR